MNLSDIVVLYLDRNFQLWGIPYSMRPHCGQTPRHLQDAGNTKGWIWLGGSGWFGSMSATDQEQVREFLATQGSNVPGSPYEWAIVEGRAVVPVTPERARQIWAQRGAQNSLDASDMTFGEQEYIASVWRQMPGDSSWMNAFFKVMNGEE